MLRRFSPVLISPVLLLTSCTQALFSQKPQPPDFEERVSMYSKPAVVRVVAACFAEYSYSSRSRTKSKSEVAEKPTRETIRSDYPKESSQTEKPGYALGTGYFIDPKGYVVTTAGLAKIAEQFGGKEKCQDHLISKIVAKNFSDDTISDSTKKKLAEDLKGDDKSAELATGETITRVELKNEDVTYFQDVILPKVGRRGFQLSKQGQIGSPSSVGPSGRDVAVIKIDDVRDAPALKLSNSDDGKAQQVLVTGYPLSADIFDPDKIQEKFNRPFFEALKNLINEPKLIPTSPRRSILSIRKLTNGSPILQIDGQVGNGSLGSPVLNEQGEVIGMVTDSSDLTYAVTSSTIREYLPSNISNDEGDTQRFYRNGLEDYWQGDYKKAVAEFKKVKSRFEDHSTVDELIKQSEAATPQNDYLPFLWSALIVVGLGVPTISYFLIHRRLQPVSVPSSPEASSYNGSTSHKPSQTGSRRPPDPTRVNLNPFIELSYQDQVLQFYLEESAYKLGRDQSWSDFEIPNKGWDLISRRHAILRKEGTDYRIYDGDGENKSSNGIFINDTRITPSAGYLLRHGVQVRIGPDQPNPVLLTYFNPANRQAPDPTRIAEL